MAYSAWESYQGSSVLSSGRYDASERKLQLRFVSGKQYEYADVPQSFWWGLCQSESKGAFFNKHISDSFGYVMLSDVNGMHKGAPDELSSRVQKPLEGPAPEVAIFDSVQNTYVPRMNLGSSPHPSAGNAHEEVSEGEAHELIDAGDFLGAVSIYELLEEEVRRGDDSSELVCYYLYNQVVCLCWAGEYPWAARCAEKLADYADEFCDGINSYEFIHSAIDCWVVRRIRAFLEGNAPEPELKLAMGQLNFWNDGVSKPVITRGATQGRGCMVLLLAIPAGLAGFLLI